MKEFYNNSGNFNISVIKTREKNIGLTSTRSYFYFSPGIPRSILTDMINPFSKSFLGMLILEFFYISSLFIFPRIVDRYNRKKYNQ